MYNALMLLPALYMPYIMEGEHGWRGYLCPAVCTTEHCLEGGVKTLMES